MKRKSKKAGKQGKKKNNGSQKVAVIPAADVSEDESAISGGSDGNEGEGTGEDPVERMLFEDPDFEELKSAKKLLIDAQDRSERMGKLVGVVAEELAMINKVIEKTNVTYISCMTKLITAKIEQNQKEQKQQKESQPRVAEQQEKQQQEQKQSKQKQQEQPEEKQQKQKPKQKQQQEQQQEQKQRPKQEQQEQQEEKQQKQQPKQQEQQEQQQEQKQQKQQPKQSKQPDLSPHQEQRSGTKSAIKQEQQKCPDTVQLDTKIAAVMARATEMVTIKMTNIDVLVTVADIVKAVKERTGVTISAPHLQRHRNMFQSAVFKIARDKGHELVSMKRLKLGYEMSKLKIVDPLPKKLRRCCRCLERGHVARKCEGVDRSNLCLQCAQPGHSSATCTEMPKCILCGNQHRMGARTCLHSASSA